MLMEPKVLLAINYYSGKNNERAKYLELFLNSIKAKTKYKNFDVIVFDDNSPFSPFDIINKIDMPIEVIMHLQPGVRWHRVRNRIHEHFLDNKQYNYLFAYDEDYEVVADNWMYHIIQCMENIDDIGILGAHWARLADGITRQNQHAPTGKLKGRNAFEVFTNKYVTGGCWTLRREVVEMYPDDGSVIYDNGHPGADTFYGWRMMEKTNYKLCTTMTDLVMHRGQEFMTGKFANKYNSEEFQAGKRLY